MKKGQKIRVKSLEFYEGEDDKRPKSILGKEGFIKDIYLGIFTIDIDGKEYKADGREIEIAETIRKQKAEFVFVSWQKNGKSVYNTKEGDPLFIGDFHHGTAFKGMIELTDEEILRINEAYAKGIVPVFDLRVTD